MRIDGGPQGYYYDQGRFRQPDAEIEDAVAAPQQQVQRAANFSPLVGTSTVLSTSLSSALWALETRAHSPAAAAAATLAPVGASEEETAEKVRAYYLEYAVDEADAA